MITLRRGTDQVVKLPRLRTATDPIVYLNAATVRGTLVDPKGNAIAAFTNVPMTYVTDSDGDYEWMIDGPTFMLPVSALYKVRIVAVQGTNDYRTVEEASIVD